MRWTNRPRSAGIQPAVRALVEGAPRPRAARTPVIAVCGLILICTILLTGAPSEKHLSVYSVAANYSLPLIQREGREYVGLLELLEPLGKVTAKSDGPRWRLRYNSRVEGDFQAGKSHARLQGSDSDLG